MIVMVSGRVGRGTVEMVALAVDNLIAALGFGPEAGKPRNPVPAAKPL